MRTWTDADRVKLLLSIIELLVPPKSQSKLPQWTLVAEKMDNEFTHEAVRQQYQKIRRESGKGSVTSTPKKGGSSSAQSTPRTGSARKRGRPSILDGLQPIPDQTEEPPSPTARKRVKMENAQSGERMMVKVEPVDENGVVLLDYDDDLYE